MANDVVEFALFIHLYKDLCTTRRQCRVDVDCYRPSAA